MYEYSLDVGLEYLADMLQITTSALKQCVVLQEADPRGHSKVLLLVPGQKRMLTTNRRCYNTGLEGSDGLRRPSA